MRYLRLSLCCFTVAAVLAWAGVGWGATVYIDPTCTNNGDGTGQDCAASPGGSGAKNTWVGLTWTAGNSYLQKAGTTFNGVLSPNAGGTEGNVITIGSYGTGDDPVINGTGQLYSVNLGGYSYITVRGLTISNATTTLLNVTTSDGVIIDDCTFSGTALNAIRSTNCALTVQNSLFSATVTYGVSSGGSNTKARTFTGNTFQGAIDNYVFDVGDTGDLIVTNNIFNMSSGTPLAIMVSNAAGASGVNTFTGNTVTGTVQITNGLIIISGGQHTVNISNNNISASHASQGNSIISLTSQANAVISGNTISTETTGACTHIRIAASGSVSGASPTVSSNILRSKGQSGYVIFIGEEATAVGKDNMIDGAIITGNKIYGGLYYARGATSTQHAVLYGFNKGATISKNYVNGGTYGIVVKGEGMDWNNTGGVFYNIFDTNNGTAQLFFKGVVKCRAYNNTFYTDPSYSVTTNFYVAANIAAAATGNSFKNNIVFGKDDDELIYVDAGGLTGFVSDNNLFWNNVGSGIDFFGGATTYTSFADWQAAGFDAHSISSNPRFNAPNSANFRPQPASKCKDAGDNTAWQTVANITDYEGVSVTDGAGAIVAPGGTVNIGAYETLRGGIAKFLLLWDE